MINTTVFTDWAKMPPATMQRFNRSSPNLVAIEAFCEGRWPGTKGNGIWVYASSAVRSVCGRCIRGVRRSICRGVACHSETAVEMIDWLIEHSAELGIQAVHDYVGSRIWRSARPGGKGGWLKQAKDADGMGQSWGDWIHIEVTEDSWADSRPVAVRIGANRPTLRQGSTGAAVVVLQQILAEKARQDVGRADGRFGPRTLTGWRNVAAAAKLPADDQVNAQDWDVLAMIDGGWARLNAAGVIRRSPCPMVRGVSSGS
jgi:hypothetical protein